MKTELQAAATSKEEALMKLKVRALQLEEELFQVRLRRELGPRPTPPSVLRADVPGTWAPVSPEAPLVLPLGSWPVAPL